MKKLCLISTIVLTFLLYNCTKSDSNEQSVNQNELLEFVNNNLKSSNFDIKANKITPFKLENYNNFKVNNIAQNRYLDPVIDMNEYVLQEPSSLALSTDNGDINLHTIPTSFTSATIYINNTDGVGIATLDIEISNYDPINDTYTINWSERSLVERGGRHDCRSGAATAAAAGRVIAFGTYLGCIPCGFVGTAISALGSLGYLACVYKGV